MADMGYERDWIITNLCHINEMVWVIGMDHRSLDEQITQNVQISLTVYRHKIGDW